jgi:hypothetical protein
MAQGKMGWSQEELRSLKGEEKGGRGELTDPRRCQKAKERTEEAPERNEGPKLRGESKGLWE